MRQCHFCDRWFTNKQAVRRHLGYCPTYLNAEHYAPPWTREPLFQCAGCIATVGREYAAMFTDDEKRRQPGGRCPICGVNLWTRGGWKRTLA